MRTRHQQHIQHVYSARYLFDATLLVCIWCVCRGLLAHRPLLGEILKIASN